MHLNRLLNRLGLAVVGFVLMEISRNTHEPTLGWVGFLLLLGSGIAFVWSALSVADDYDQAIQWAREHESDAEA